MNTSLIRLKEIFSESGVTCIRDLKRLSSRQFQRLDASVYGWFSSFRNDQIRALAGTDGVNLCLGLKNAGEEYAVGAPMEMIVKKLVFFSETGVVLTPKFHYPGNSRRAVPDSWYYLALNYMPLWEAGMLTIMPKSVTHLIEIGRVQGETFIIKGQQPRIVEKNWFLLKEEIPSLKVIDLSEKALADQLLEVNPNYGSPIDKPVYIFLPHLSNLSTELVSAIRRDHGDVFADYHRTVQSFFIQSSKAKTEQKLFEVMRATDAGIRKIESEFSKISRSQTLQQAEVALKLSAGVLCLFAHSELVKTLGPIVAGGGLGSSTLKYFQLKADKKSLMASTPFYYPWLIHQQASKHSANG